jgi:hypothetical protein
MDDYKEKNKIDRRQNGTLMPASCQKKRISLWTITTRRVL